MSDQNINIGIKATGGTEAAGEIQKSAKALNAPGTGLADSAKRASDKVTNLASQQNKFSASSFSMRGAMQNIGFQIQDIAVQAEMGTNAMRIVSQQVPQMLGAFGMWGAAAGAVIAIGAPLIGSFMGQGEAAKKTKKHVNELADEYKELADVYAELEKGNLESIRESSKKTSDEVQGRLSSIDFKSKVDLDASSVEGAKAKAAATIELANQRLTLATLESAMVTATGKTALDLAKAREQVILNIFGTELKISEEARKQAIKQAEIKVAGAGGKVDTLTEEATKAQAEYFAALKEQEDLREAAELKKQQRWEKIADLEDQLLKAKIKLENPDPKMGIGPQGDYERTRLLGTIENINKAIDKERISSKDEGDLYVQANAKQPAIDELKKILSDSEKAQAEAFRALTTELTSITTLRRNQETDRQTEGKLKFTSAEGDIGGKVTNAAREAIKQIQGAGLDKTPGAGSEAVEGITKLISDTTPDAQQGGQLAGLLQQLANNLTGKDRIIAGNVETLIDTVKSLKTQHEQLKTKVHGLKTNVGQAR